jgi:hypothetical protein
MKEFILTSPEGLTSVSGYVCDHFDESNKPLRITATEKNNGTLPMLRVWRMWMSEIAKFQADRGYTMPLFYDSEGNPHGQRRFNGEDAHEAYTHLCLGCDENGIRLSWAVNSDEYEGRRAATIGQKLHAMQKIHQFCIEHAIPITIPDDSEYAELMRQQDK